MHPRTLFVLLATVATLPFGAAGAQREAPGTVHHWYRGNTHTHTKNSDGDGNPMRVVEWYRDHGYQFIFITDHEYATPVAGLNSVMGAPGRFLVLPGQELTQWSYGTSYDTTMGPERRVRAAPHVNALGTTKVIYPVGEVRCIGEGCGRVAAANVPFSELYRQNLTAIRNAGGIAQVNHPNGLWSDQPKDLYGIPDSTLLEVWNATPGAHNLGGADDEGHVSLSTEAIWDTLLSRGKVVWGVGSDDTHDYFRTETAPDDADAAPPGRAWIMVRADTLTPEAIYTALHRGHFYASTGVTLREITASDTMLAITIRPLEDERYHTQFIGMGGRVLADVPGMTPRYRITANDRYVRAVVIDSNNRKAWVQPTFIRR